MAGWLAGWLAGKGGWLAAWLACAPCATFFVDSSTKMDAPMVAQEFLPRAGWLAAWFLMSLINVALRALPELDQNENKKRKRSDWTRLTKSHENKRSGSGPAHPHQDHCLSKSSSAEHPLSSGPIPAFFVCDTAVIQY